MYPKSIRLYSIAQTCLISFLISQIKCEKQYELNCLNKDCTGVLFEGFSQFVHPEDSDLIKLGKGENFEIYGENDEFYLIQKQNRKGLVKRSYVKITKDLSKDKSLIKIRTSFTNKKLNLINIDENQIEKNDSSVDTIVNPESNEQQPNLLSNNQPPQEDIPNDSFNEIKINLDETTTSSIDQQPNEPAVEIPRLKPKFLNVPLVQTLHHPNNLKTDQPENETENLNLKEPEIQNFSNDEKLDSNKQTNESVNKLSNERIDKPIINEPINKIANESLDALKNESIDVDQSNESGDQTNQSNDELNKSNEIPSSESVKIPHVNAQNDKKEEQINKFDLNSEDLNALKDSYKESIDKEDTPPLKLKEFESESKDTPSIASNETSSNENITSNPIDKVQHVNEESNLESTNKVTDENILKNENIAQELNKTEVKIEENEQKRPSNEPFSTDSPSAEQPTKNISNLENLKTKIPNVHLHNLPKENSAQTIDQSINENDQHTNQIKNDQPITPPSPINNQNLDQENLSTLNQQQSDDLTVPKLEIPQSNNIPENNPSIVEPKVDQQLVDEPSLNKELPDNMQTEIPKNYDQEIEHPKHAKIINLKNKKILHENIRETVEEPINDVEESVQMKDEIKEQLNKVDSTNMNEPLKYCQADQTSRAGEEPNFYIIALRSVLGKFVDMFPEGMLLFLEMSLQISAKLLIFVFLIGLLWVVLFTIKFIHLSISKETVLKNYLCESQSRIYLIQRERDDLRNKLNAQNLKMTKGLEEQKYEVNQLVNKLSVENKQLKENNSRIENELEDQSKLVKSLETKIDQLNENNVTLFRENDELNEQLNDEITAKEELKKKLNKIEELNKELILKNEEVERQIEEHKSKIDYFSDKLDEQRKLTTEKEIEIGCLNKMLDELKESKGKNHDLELEEQNEESNTTNGINTGSVNFYDIVKLRCEIEKLEKEGNDSKDKLKASLDKIESLEQKLEQLELENSQFSETRSKVLREKEEAEKYLDFLKKYYNENKNELQKELGVYQYKEKQLREENNELRSKYENLEQKFEENDQKCQAIKKEFEEVEKQLREELLTSNKSAGEYFKSAQALKAELSSVKKDNEYLRQQLRNPSASTSKSSTTTMMPPPEMPKAVLEFFGQLSAGQIAASTASGLPNFNSLNSFNNLNNISNPNFITAPSPIQPHSLGYDYQQLAAANYHSSFTNLPFIPQPQSQPSTSIYNNVISTSNANNFQQIIDPMMIAQTSSAVDVYNQHDDHYASLPNINYSNSQQPSIDQRFNQSLAQQQNQWNHIRTDTPLDQTGEITSNSPHPSLHNV